MVVDCLAVGGGDFFVEFVVDSYCLHSVVGVVVVLCVE